jgi:hypothetical protein
MKGERKLKALPWTKQAGIQKIFLINDRCFSNYRDVTAMNCGTQAILCVCSPYLPCAVLGDEAGVRNAPITHVPFLQWRKSNVSRFEVKAIRIIT